MSEVEKCYLVSLKKAQQQLTKSNNNIQIIIDGNRNHIEQGQDERGRFYKVYYNEEE